MTVHREVASTVFLMIIFYLLFALLTISFILSQFLSDTRNFCYDNFANQHYNKAIIFYVVFFISG